MYTVYIHVHNHQYYQYQCYQWLRLLCAWARTRSKRTVHNLRLELETTSSSTPSLGSKNRRQHLITDGIKHCLLHLNPPKLKTYQPPYLILVTVMQSFQFLWQHLCLWLWVWPNNQCNISFHYQSPAKGNN